MKFFHRLSFFALLISACGQTLPVAAHPLTAQAHRAISTRVPAAQSWFDRGLLMLYAFNIGQAKDDFAQAQKLDPECAMAYWGIAVADSTDINVPVDESAQATSAAFLAKGLHASEASPQERELLAALASRFRGVDDQQTREDAYAHAMQAYSARYPDDADGLVFTTLALWHAHDPHEPGADLAAIRAYLNRAVALDPANVGARHLRIHYFETIGDSRRALPDAFILLHTRYDLGESHLPHMAGHIYLALGDYEQAASANSIAFNNDKRYFALGNGPGQAYMADYHTHVLFNLLYALTTMGETQRALGFVQRDGGLMYDHLAVRERMWPLRKPNDEPGEYISVGVASARHGDSAMVKQMVKKLEAIAKDSADAASGLLLIDAALARRVHDLSEVVRDYAQLYHAYSYMRADPPMSWQVPIPEGYGAALLQMHAYAKAESVFHAALVHQPGDPRLWWGLATAQRSQGKDATAALAAYCRTWHGAVALTIDDLG